ncbi:hypothetical protein ACXAT3_001446 [Clostridium sporogenes]
MKNIKLIKYIVIVIFCSILDMILYVITLEISPFRQYGDFSFLVKAIGAPGAAMVCMLVAFSSIAYVFYKQESLLVLS